MSITTPRPARQLREEVKQKLDNNDTYIGEKIALKTLRVNKIDTSGTLTHFLQCAWANDTYSEDPGSDDRGTEGLPEKY